MNATDAERLMSDRDLKEVTLWEIIFIFFAAAFTLDEYTVANEYGWISMYYNPVSSDFLIWLHMKVYVANASPSLESYQHF